VQGIVDERDETIFLIEPARLLIKGLYFNGMDSKSLSDLKASSESVKEKSFSKPLTLRVLINGKAR